MRSLLWQCVTLLLQVILSSGWNFIRCPESCRCYSEENLNIVDCSNLWLEQFPQPEAIPSDVHLINVSYNSIRSVPVSYKFWFPEAVEVDISHNQLESMPNFEGFYRLKRLNLAHNSIRHIPEETFVHMSYLEELNLAHNLISFISKTAFRNLYSLHRLDLSQNNLETVPLAVDIHNLEELYLDDNLIETVLPEFLNLSNLQTLSLAGNKITYMKPTSLENCHKLKILNLARNKFMEVPQQILHAVAATLTKLNLSATPTEATRSNDFINLLAVQEIDLSRTNITAVQANSFRNLPELLHLHLNDNPKLRYIDNGAFRLLPSLSLLHLHNCNLTGLHNLSAELSSLQQLTLYGNPVLCDCNLKWLQQAGDVLVHKEQLTCISGTAGVRNLNLSTFEIPEKCAPRIVGLPSNTTVMEGQRTVLSCDTLGNPKPTIQWRIPYDGSIAEGQYVTFEKIVRNQSGTYRCVAYSEAGLAESEIFVNVIPLLQFHVRSNFLEEAVISWCGNLPTIKSTLRIRFRDSDKEFVKDVLAAEVDEKSVTIRFFWDLFPENFEFCLMDGATEIACDFFHRPLRRFDRVCQFLILMLAIILYATLTIWVRFYNLKTVTQKDEQQQQQPENGPEKMIVEKEGTQEKETDDREKRVTLVMEIEDFQKVLRSSAAAALILNRPKMRSN